jgi:replicative DNA helicase
MTRTNDHEAERLLVSYLLAGDADVDGVHEITDGLTESDFDGQVMRNAFVAIDHLVRENVALSTASVADALHSLGIASPTHTDLRRLVLDSPCTLEAAKAAKGRLRELARWRVLLDLGDSWRTAFARGGVTVEQIMSQALVDFDELSRQSAAQRLLLGEVQRKRVEEIAAAEGKPTRRILTGFGILDALVGGFGESDLATLAAGTGVGKTTFALQIISSVARTGRKSLVASAEMQAWELADRTLSQSSYVPASAIRDGRVDAEQLAKLREVARNVAWDNVSVIERNGALTIDRIVRCARDMQRREGLALVVVDYVQLITATLASGERGRTREAEVSAVARGLKNLAMELRVPVLALSQFNREAAKNGEPELHHLRDSGEIEQASNMVLFLWRKDDDPDDLVRLVCKKHRAGQKDRGTQLRWTGANLTFSPRES